MLDEEEQRMLATLQSGALLPNVITNSPTIPFQDAINGANFEAMQDIVTRSRFRKAPVRAVTSEGNGLSQEEFDDWW